MNQIEARVTFAEIFSGMVDVVTRNIRLVGLYAVATGIGATVLEKGLSSDGILIEMVANVAATYFLTLYLLRAERLAGPRSGNFGGYFGASLLSGLGMLFGFLLFVIPGLILLSRWSIASAIAITENVGATEAMRQSWEATRRSQWSIVGFYAVGFIGLIIVVGGAGGLQALGALGTGPVSLAGETVVNIITQAGSAAFDAAMVVILLKLRPADNILTDVFA